jgi:hypothetical protein
MFSTCCSFSVYSVTKLVTQTHEWPILRNLALRKAEKEEEQRARDNILKKLEQDKV